MKIVGVKYTQHYDEYGQLKAVWVGVEGSLDDSEGVEGQLDKLKEITDKWYQSRHPQAGMQGPPMHFAGSVTTPRIIDIRPEDREPGVTVESIMSCQDLVTLHSYKLIVRGCSDDIRDAYRRKEKEFMDKM